MHLMLQQDQPKDYVIATGQQFSVRDFVNVAGREVGFDIRWEGKGVDEKGFEKHSGKCIVAVDKRYYRPTEVETLLGDASLAEKVLGWKPKTSFEEMVAEMVAQDLRETRRDLLCRKEGFSIKNYYE
jgi:GDPmannose 4,6-dehydratase